MRLVFRLDANTSVGAGHLMRCLALAQKCLAGGHTVNFCGNIDSGFHKLLKTNQITYHSSCSDALNSADRVVLDCYRPLKELLNSIPMNVPVILFEDLNNRQSDRAMLVVNAMGLKEDLVKRYPKSVIVTGVDYLLFRSEIEKLRFDRGKIYPQGQRETQPIDVIDVAITLGASDQSLLFSEIVRLIQGDSSLPHKRLNITLYSASLSTQVEQALTQVGSTLVTCMQEGFLKRLASFDLIISAAGQTLIECAYLGLPVIGLVIADNQQACGAKMQALGLPVINILDDIEWQQSLLDAIEKLASLPAVHVSDVSSQAGSALPGTTSIGSKGKQLVSMICGEWS